MFDIMYNCELICFMDFDLLFSNVFELKYLVNIAIL